MKQPSITSLPPSPADERRSRMRKYSIAMGVRLLCIVALLFVHGWWMLVFAIGAVVLPWFAVVIANVGSPAERGNVERPGALLPLGDATRRDRPAPEPSPHTEEPRAEPSSDNDDDHPAPGGAS